MKKRKAANLNKDAANKFKLLMGLLLILGLLGIFIYSTNNQLNASAEQRTTQPKIIKASDQEQTTINCAQKIDQNGEESLLSQKPGETNCLYLGCGGFF